MKVTRCDDTLFRPVTVVLESQKEVDELFAVLSVTLTLTSRAAIPTIGDTWEKLQPYASPAANGVFDKISNTLA